MGVSYYAVSGIGILIDFNALPAVEVSRPSCPHPEAKGNKFCPVCGVQVRTVVEQNRDIAYEVREHLEGKKLPDGYIFHFANYDSTQYFLGWGKGSASWKDDDFTFTKLCEIPSSDEVRDTIKRILSEVKEEVDDAPDIFNEAKFGYWSGIAAS